MGRKVPRDSSPACSFKVSGSQCPRSSRLGFMSHQSFRFQCSDPHLVPCCVRTHPHEFQSMIALRPAAKAAGCSAPTLLALIRCGAFCQRQSASKAVGRTARSCWRRERNLNTPWTRLLSLSLSGGSVTPPGQANVRGALQRLALDTMKRPVRTQTAAQELLASCLARYEAFRKPSSATRSRV
jgi:hypothetical protein